MLAGWLGLHPFIVEACDGLSEVPWGSTRGEVNEGPPLGKLSSAPGQDPRMRSSVDVMDFQQPFPGGAASWVVLAFVATGACALMVLLVGLVAAVVPA